jgi:hypothetical protein
MDGDQPTRAVSQQLGVSPPQLLNTNLLNWRVVTAG